MKNIPIVLSIIILIFLGACGDDPKPEKPPSNDGNTSVSSEGNATGLKPEGVFFGPPAGAEVVLALRSGDVDASLRQRLIDWLPVGTSGNASFPKASILDAFSQEDPVYFYVKGSELGLMGKPAETIDPNLSIPGFSRAIERDRMVFVSGDSNESALQAQAILFGMAGDKLPQAIDSFTISESNSSLALYLKDHSVGIEAWSKPGEVGISIKKVDSNASASITSGNPKWDLVPAESAFFFGSAQKDELIELTIGYLLEKANLSAGSENNTGKSWTENLAGILGTKGAPGVAFENPIGGSLFALAPPTEGNETKTYPIPEEMKSASTILLADFPRLGALLRTSGSGLLGEPLVGLACERAGKLTLLADAGSADVRLSWVDDSSDGLATLSAFLQELSRRTLNRNFYQAILKEDLEAVQKTLNSAEATSLNLAGRISPLHFAAWQGKLSSLGLCLQRKMDADLLDDSNRTALHMAAWSGNPEAADLLLDYNATPDARNSSGTTPAMEAARIGHPTTLGLLLEAGADINATDLRGNGLAEYAASGGNGALIKILRRRGIALRNPVHVAAGAGDLATLQTLVTDKNSTNLTDGWGATPILFAAAAGKAKTFSYLLEKGADPKAKDGKGLTLVHAAALSGHPEILAQALALNLDPNPRHAERGATPLDWAIARKDAGAVKALRAAGAKSGRQLGSAKE